MSHFDDLGLSAPPGATLRSARERYITDGHLDDEHASAMRRVTATLERARYDRPERTTPEQTEELHRDIRSIRRQVSGHPRVDDPGQVLPLAHRGRLGVAWADESAGTDRAPARIAAPAAAACWSDARAEPRGPLPYTRAHPRVTVGGEGGSGSSSPPRTRVRERQKEEP